MKSTNYLAAMDTWNRILDTVLNWYIVAFLLWVFYFMIWRMSWSYFDGPRSFLGGLIFSATLIIMISVFIAGNGSDWYWPWEQFVAMIPVAILAAYRGGVVERSRKEHKQRQLDKVRSELKRITTNHSIPESEVLKLHMTLEQLSYMLNDFEEYEEKKRRRSWWR